MTSSKRAKFTVFKDANGLYRWNLKAANGEICCQSEAYRSERDATRGKNDAIAAYMSAVGLMKIDEA